MALRELATETMSRLTEAWIDPAHDRALLEAVPLAAALLPRLEEAHRGLQRPAATDSVAAAEIAYIEKEEQAADLRHDRKQRGTFAVLTGFAELVDEAESVEEILALRDELFPN